MKIEIQKLASLSFMDNEIDALAEELDLLPELIRTINNELSAQQAGCENKKKEIAGLEKEINGKQIELSDQKDWLAKRETRLKEIKTNKEYHSALKEVSQAKKAVELMEETIKNLTQKIGEETAKIEELTTNLAEQKLTLEKQLAEKNAEIDALKQKIDEKIKLRSEEESKIDENFLKRYKTIKSRLSPALSLASQGCCSECNTCIPPQMFIELQKLDQLITCPRCHRILFVET